MNRKAIPVFAAMLVSATSYHTTGMDFFPIERNGFREFSYKKDGGGLGVVGHEEGTVEWRVIESTYGLSKKTYFIGQAKIEQRRYVSHASISSSPLLGPGYDTVYSPPRFKSVDTLWLFCPGNVVWTRVGSWQYPKDPCRFFIHDTAAVKPSDSLKIVSDSVICMGVLRKAVRVISSSCPCGCATRDCGTRRYFTLADNIGPVAYKEMNSPCIEDANYTEAWVLKAISTTHVFSPNPATSRFSGHRRIDSGVYNLLGKAVNPDDFIFMRQGLRRAGSVAGIYLMRDSFDKTVCRKYIDINGCTF